MTITPPAPRDSNFSHPASIPSRPLSNFSSLRLGVIRSTCDTASRASGFAGAGFNLTNRYAVAGVKRAGAKYFTLSAELSLREQNALAAEGGFALSSGDIKVMELCYCPFSRACGTCDRRDLYTLTDEEGRRFPMRRYRVSGDCRFELFNCSPLQTTRGTASALIDDTTRGGATGCATRGHTDRSML